MISLVCHCGTTRAATPPGIAANHMYSVLSFDVARNVVQVWNPHGNSFTPEGPLGAGSP